MTMTGIILVFQLFLCVLWLQQVHADLTPCPVPAGDPSCVCESSKGTIDLRTIALNDGSPRFKDISDGTYTYDYNPCYGFSLGDGSKCSSGTASCQENSDNTVQYSLGKTSTEQIYYDDQGKYQIQYNGGTKDRRTVVNLHCDHHTRLTASGDSETTLLYVFDLYTKEVCFKSSGNIGGAIGFSLIAISFAGLLTYFIAGILILKFHYKRSGFELIPQRHFWFSLPFLVKDGVLFTFSPIIRLARKDYQPVPGYNKA